MSSRNKKILAVVLAVLILLLLLVRWLTSQQPPEDVTFINTQPDTTAGAGALGTTFGANVERIPVTQVTETARPQPEDPDKPDPMANLRSLALSIAERYGSFSNQGDFENLRELKVFMTDSLAAEVEAYIGEAGARAAVSPAYVGMTTRSLSATIDRFDEAAGTASVTVNTQRQETTGSGTQVFYQELMMDFVRSGEIWQVDSIKWAEE
jgi:hypothetical protein